MGIGVRQPCLLGVCHVCAMATWLQFQAECVESKAHMYCGERVLASAHAAAVDRARSCPFRYQDRVLPDVGGCRIMWPAHVGPLILTLYLSNGSAGSRPVLSRLVQTINVIV